MAENAVNQQHLAAMGIDPDRLGNPATPEEIRCPSTHPMYPTRRCVRKTGHPGAHARAGDTWEPACNDHKDVGGFPYYCTLEVGHEGEHQAADLSWGSPTKTRPGDQVLPSGGQQCVQDLVIAEMEESKRVGLERYGSTLMTFNGRKGIQDVQEEARDFFVYMTQIKAESEADRETLVDVVAAALSNGPAAPYLTEIAEAAVDAVMGWVVGQRMSQIQALGGPDDIYELLDNAWGFSGGRSEIVESQTHAVMARLGIEMEER